MWEEGKLYRTEKLSKKIKDNILEFPICVPSYGRPVSGITKILDKEPDLPVVLFIREEQAEMYAPLKGKCKIVKLKGMENIGQTRAAIVRWAQKKGYTNIFMFDDRVNEVNFLAPKLSKKGNWSMGKASKTVKEALQVWEWFVERYNPCISGASHKGFSWSPSFINAAPYRNSKECQIAIHLNVGLMYDNGIQYRDCKECGSEDAAMSFDIMSKGLDYLVFADLEYNNIPSSNNNGGGIQGAEGKPVETRIERFARFNELFKKNVSGENHPGISFRKAEGDVVYVKFIWKYWRELYQKIQGGE